MKIKLPNPGAQFDARPLTEPRRPYDPERAFHGKPANGSRFSKEFIKAMERQGVQIKHD